MSFKERNEDYRALEERGCVKIIFRVVTTGLRLRIENRTVSDARSVNLPMPGNVGRLLAAGIRSWLGNVCDQHKPERQPASGFHGFRQERKLAGGSLQQRSEQGAFASGKLQADRFFSGHCPSIGGLKLPSANDGR